MIVKTLPMVCLQLYLIHSKVLLLGGPDDELAGGRGLCLRGDYFMIVSILPKFFTLRKIFVNSTDVRLIA